MFVKHDIDTNKEIRRVVQRAAAVSTSFTLSQSAIDYIKSKVIEALTQDAIDKNAYLDYWIKELFSPSSTAFINKLNEYANQWTTDDIVARVINAIKLVDFNSTDNKQVIINGLGTQSYSQILSQLNGGTGATQVVINALTTGLTLKETPESIIVTEATKIITAELAKISMPTLAQNSALYTFIHSTDFTSQLQTLKNSALSAATSLSPELSVFKNKATFVTEVDKLLRQELLQSGKTTALASKYANHIKDFIVNSIGTITPITAVTRPLSQTLLSQSKLTIDQVKDLLPSLKTFLDNNPSMFQYMKFWVTSGISNSIILHNAFQFPALSETSNGIAPSDFNIPITDVRPTVDIIYEELTKVIGPISEHDLLENTLISDLALADINALVALDDGQFHNITPAQFNVLTGLNIDTSTIRNDLTYNLQFKIKFDKATKKIHFKVDIEAPTAPSSERLKTWEIDTTHVSYTYFVDWLGIDAADRMPDHPTVNVLSSMTHITSETEIHRWFTDKITPVKDAVETFNTLIVGQDASNANRYTFESYVKEFDPSSNLMTIFFKVHDTHISGSPIVATQKYTVHLNNLDNGTFYLTKAYKDIESAFNNLAPQSSGIFSHTNLDGPSPNLNLPVGTHGDQSTWDSAAASLDNDLKILVNQLEIHGNTYATFKELYDNFFLNPELGLNIEWDGKIQKNPDIATSNWGVLFKYYLNYYPNLFAATEPTATDRKEFKFFKDLGHISASQAFRDAKEQEVLKEAHQAKDTIRIVFSDKPIEMRAKLADIDLYTAKCLNVIKNPNSSELEINASIALMKAALAALLPGMDMHMQGQTWYAKLIKDFGGQIPPDIAKAIAEHPDFFKSLVEYGQSIESIKMLARNQHLMNELLTYAHPENITKVLNTLNDVHKNYKYTYLGLGAGLGAAGLASGAMAVNSIRANKKVKLLDDKSIKMRGTKIVSAIATGISLTTLLSSVAFMVLFFVNKGGF